MEISITFWLWTIGVFSYSFMTGITGWILWNLYSTKNPNHPHNSRGICGRRKEWHDCGMTVFGGPLWPVTLPILLAVMLLSGGKRLLDPQRRHERKLEKIEEQKERLYELERADNQLDNQMKRLIDDGHRDEKVKQRVNNLIFE